MREDRELAKGFFLDAHKQLYTQPVKNLWANQKEIFLLLVYCFLSYHALAKAYLSRKKARDCFSETGIEGD
jgi:hypothetical protein